MYKIAMALALWLLVTTLTAARADEATVELKVGNGVEETSSNCAACHSLDYIKMNSPFLSADGWKAEVTKMRKAFGANIDDDVAGKISAYLSAQYGPAT